MIVRTVREEHGRRVCCVPNAITTLLASSRNGRPQRRTACRSTDPVANQVSVSTRPPRLWIESATLGDCGSQLPADKRRLRQGHRAVMDSFHIAASAAAERQQTC